jgi:hypothetical protein
MHRALTSVTAALLIALPASLHGQATLQSAVGGGAFSGDDYENVEAGFSIGGGLLFDATENVQVGGEFYVHSMGVENTDENLDQFDVLAKARYLLPGESTRFFVGAKAGYARQSFESLGVDLNSDGFTAGPVLGVQIPVSSLMVELKGDVMYVAQELSEDELIDPDADMDDTGGVRYSIQAGLAIPLGGG